MMCLSTVTEKDFSSRLKEKVTLVHTPIRLFPYKSKTSFELLGKFTVSVSTRKGYDVAEFNEEKQKQYFFVK